MSEDLVLYTHPMSRGRIARWMLEEVGQPYRTEVLEFGTTMKAPEGRQRMAGYGCFASVMDALESAVSASDYVAGDRFTAADVYFGSQIGWGLIFGTIEKRPAFEAYWSRISARPAAVRAREIDDALMPKQA